MKGLIPLLLVLAIGKSYAEVDPTPEEAYADGCGACHEEGLGPRSGIWYLRATQGPERALLSNRSDLTAAYIRTVVRKGLSVMPPITRGEVSDEQLELIVTYLTQDAGS